MRIQALSLQHVAGSLKSWQRDWGGALTTALAFVFLSYVAWMVFGQPSDKYKTLVTDLVQPIVSLGMTILAFRASRQYSLSSQNRRAWTLIAIAFLMYFMGNVMWGYYELVLGNDLSVTLADVPYLCYYPICLAGLLTFPMTQ